MVNCAVIGHILQPRPNRIASARGLGELQQRRYVQTLLQGELGLAKRVNTVHTVEDLREIVADWRAEGHLVGLVATMGALHEGHTSLIGIALEHASRVIVSIFVNPTQFAPNEDFAAYPRDTAGDNLKVTKSGAHLIYAPNNEEMYASDFSTQIFVGGVSDGLCGAARPHFFSGVATVVAKLFLQAMPDITVFGEKDYQQLLVVKRMVRDLDLPIEIIHGPIVRESDGLALSSRNAYLSEAERAVAPLLNRVISDIASDVGEGRAVAESLEAGRVRLDSTGFLVDYLELRGAENLAPITDIAERPARVFVAAHLGSTRLIDNVAVNPSTEQRRT